VPQVTYHLLSPLLACGGVSRPVGLKIEIHEIHQNLRNPINKNPPSAKNSLV